jgi:hypothetical protein
MTPEPFRPRVVVPIVEGRGEVSAVPVLLRRFIKAAEAYGLAVGRPVLRHRRKLVNRDYLQGAIALAMRQPGCAAILVLFDADEPCDAAQVRVMKEWARAAAARLPCEVVVVREYEAWFLAAIESLRGRRRIALEAEPPPSPENIRGAKQILERWMPQGVSYAPRTDQPALTALFCMKTAYARCRSFRQVVKAFRRLAEGAGVALGEWPPGEWTTC